MCGRFTRKFTWAQIHRLSTLTTPELEFTPSYNVAPTQLTPILRVVSDQEGKANNGSAPLIGMVSARWGLVPSWADDEKIGNRMINARAETVAEKPAFRNSFKRRRCVIPISGFYEWQPIEGSKVKQPWYFARADEAPMLLAGLWDCRGELETFTIITTTANVLLAQIHDRMPVVLEPEEVNPWFAGDLLAAKALLDPAADGVLVGYRVGTQVNTPKNDLPGLIAPLSGA